MHPTTYPSERGAMRLLAAMLAAVILALPFAGTAAAEETVQSVSFQDIGTTLSMYVGDEQQLTAIASVSGGTSSNKDVTLDAVWTTSKSSVVKVDKGLLTAQSAGYADITAVYRSVSKTVRVTVAYEYDKVEISLNGSPAESPQDGEIGSTPAFTLQAYKGGMTTAVTEEADWSSSNPAVASITDGRVKLISQGTTTITAKYKGRSDSIKLNVTSPYKELVILPSSLLEFEYGDAARNLIAEAEKKDGSKETVTLLAEWTSSNEAVAAVEDGLVKPVGIGTATIEATHLGVSKSLQVVVRPAFEALRLSVDKPLHLQLTDQPVQLQVTAADNPDDEPINVTGLADWESDNAYAVTVSSSGLITPKETGIARITVSYKGLSQAVDVAVYPSIVSLSIDGDDKDDTFVIDGFIDSEGELPVVLGETLKGDEMVVSGLAQWTSGNTDIVVIEDGRWKAKKLGETKLTARIGTRSASVKIIVHEKPLALLAAADELSIVAGKSVDLPDLTLLLANGEKVEEIEPKVKWSVSSPNILIKENKLHGLLPGRYTLTAQYLGKKATTRVTVEEEIVTIIIDPQSLSLHPGNSKSIKVKGFYKNGKHVMLTTKLDWKSDNPNIVTVKGSSIKAAAHGTTRVTAEYQGKTLTVPVTVTPKLTKLTASMTSVKLSRGEAKQIALTAQYDKKTESIVTSSAVWKSSNADVAAVSNGKITAVGKGSTTIKATFGGKTVSIRVHVK